MSGNRCTGTSEVEVSYCGHRAWDAYTNRDGKPIQAGGAVTVREDFTDHRTGELSHELNEYRLPAVGAAEVAQDLAKLECGDRIVLQLEHWRSPRGKTWDDLVAFVPSDDHVAA